MLTKGAIRRPKTMKMTKAMKQSPAAAIFVEFVIS